jgi:hypothetical protein
VAGAAGLARLAWRGWQLAWRSIALLQEAAKLIVRSRGELQLASKARRAWSGARYVTGRV